MLVATNLIPSFVAGGPPAPEPEIVDVNGDPVTEVYVGEHLFVRNPFISSKMEDIDYISIMLVKDDNGFTKLLSLTAGHVKARETAVPIHPWMADKSGQITIQFFVWSSLDQPIPISSVKTVTVSVFPLVKILYGSVNPEQQENYSPQVIKVVLGVNSTVVWLNEDLVPSSVTSDQGHFDSGPIQPNQTWSYTFTKEGIYDYHSEPHPWMKGVVIVTTAEIESSNLTPSKPFRVSAEELAKMLVAAMNDQIVTKRLDTATDLAYTTKKGDIIIPKITREYSPVQYRVEESVIKLYEFYESKSELEALEFMSNFMRSIGLKLDGSEWINVENFGDSIVISMHQTNHGWIVMNEFVRFSFYKDRLWIEMGRWYDDIQKMELRISQDDAKGIAKKFMDLEIEESAELRRNNYFSGKAHTPRMEIVDHKLMYVVPVHYESEEKFEGYHCPLRTFEVFVDPHSGMPFGWRFPACE